MAETLAYNFVGNDELSRVFEALDRVANKLERTFDSLGDQASQAGRKMGTAGTEAKVAGEEFKGAGDDADKLARKVDELGDDMDKTALKAAVFDAQIKQARRSVRELTDEFVRTGNVDVLNKLGSHQGRLSELEKLKQDLTSTLDEAGVVGGRGFLGSFGNAVSSGLSSGVDLPFVGGLSAEMTTAAAAAAPAIVPAIAAAANAGILAGVGGGGLAAGILLASKDSRVIDAWTQFGHGAMDELNSAVGVFVQPLVHAAQIVSGAFDSVMPGIRRDFAVLAPVVDDIARGFGGFLTNVMPGFDRALQSSAPLLHQIGAEMPKLGSAMSSFFDSIARGGPGATMVFHDLMVFLDGSVVLTGKLVENLSKAWELSQKIPGLGGLIQTIGNMTKDSGDKAKDAAGKIDGLGDSADRVVAPLDGASQAVGRLEGSFRNAIQQAGFFSKTLDNINGGNIALATSQIDVESALQRFKDALKESGGSMDIHTEKGRAAKQAALDLVTATGDLAQKTYEQSGSASQGSKVLDQYRQQLENTMVQSGMTKDAAHALVDQWLHMPDSVSTQVNAPGLAQTKADAEETYRGLDHLDGKTATAYVDIVYRDPGHYDANGNFHRGPAQFSASGGRVGHRAMGGLSGGWYDVGEDGPERVVLPDDAWVIPNNQLHNTGSATPAVSNQFTINVNAGMGTDGHQLGAQIVEAIKDYELTAGRRWRS